MGLLPEHVEDGEKADGAVFDAFRTKVQFRHIMETLVPRFLRHQAHKSLDYGDAALHLGVRGQFADINRKYWKLKRALWDGEPLVGEPVEEVLLDLIGHCFLTLNMLEQGNSTEAKR